LTDNKYINMQFGEIQSLKYFVRGKS